MSNDPESKLSKEMQEDLQAIYTQPRPNPSFVDHLGHQLSAQIEHPTTNRLRFQRLISLLAWAGAGMALIVILSLSITRLLPPSEPGRLIPGGVVSPTSTIESTLIPALPTSQEPLASPTATPTLEATLYPNLYPSPFPFITLTNGLSTSGCPNSEGIQATSQLTLDEAFPVMQAINSGRLDVMRKVSDPTFWDYFYLPPNDTTSPIEKDWLEVKPADQSEYALLIQTACGDAITNESWSVVNCGTSCQSALSPALFSHYFLINRNGFWLIWASYP
jgi:hypothetical protein